MPQYNCSKCPGYCCSYPVIGLTKNDVKRLAKHFGIGFRKAKAKYTVPRDDEDYTMRRKADVHFGRVCQFFDTDERRIHAGRNGPMRAGVDGHRVTGR